MTKKYLFKMFKSEKCFTMLEIREMPIKTILRFHIAAVRMARINKTTGKGGRGRGHRRMRKRSLIQMCILFAGVIGTFNPWRC